jgi:hypothetical protein
MLKRLSSLPMLAFIVLSAPLQAIAQQPSQPPLRPKIIIMDPALGIICGVAVTGGTVGGCSH